MINLDQGQITDILPDNLKDAIDVQCISFAIMVANQKMLEYANQSRVYAAIKDMDDTVLDVLAVELRSQYYNNALPIATKRIIVANTLLWYTKAGTPSAVEELVSSVFGEGIVKEWFDTGGEPGTFDVITSAPLVDNMIDEFKVLLKKVKNTRSHLNNVSIIREIDNTSKVGIGSNVIGNIIIKNY